MPSSSLRRNVELGGICRSSVYGKAGLPEGHPLKLDAVKDGRRTKITTESIERHNRNLPPAEIKAAKPAKSRRSQLEARGAPGG